MFQTQGVHLQEDNFVTVRLTRIGIGSLVCRKGAFCWYILYNVHMSCYSLDGPGIESRWGGANFPHRPWGPPSLQYNGYQIFLGGKAAGAWH